MHKFDGSGLFQGEIEFRGKPAKVLGFTHFS